MDLHRGIGVRDRSRVTPRLRCTPRAISHLFLYFQQSEVCHYLTNWKMNFQMFLDCYSCRGSWFVDPSQLTCATAQKWHQWAWYHWHFLRSNQKRWKLEVIFSLLWSSKKHGWMWIVRRKGETALVKKLAAARRCGLTSTVHVVLNTIQTCFW